MTDLPKQIFGWTNPETPEGYVGYLAVSVDEATHQVIFTLRPHNSPSGRTEELRMSLHGSLELTLRLAIAIQMLERKLAPLERAKLNIIVERVSRDFDKEMEAFKVAAELAPSRETPHE